MAQSGYHQCMMNRFLIVLAVLTLLAPPLARAEDRPLTVIEMFTSQGCSSCPPADALLGLYAKRDDILALSMHVDYWDYIGWKDPFALPINTERQRLYARKMWSSFVYTPQAVVQGMAHATGSSQRKIDKLIADLKGAKRLGVTAVRTGDAVRIDIDGGVFPDEDAIVYLAGVDAKHDTDVRRGENAGHILSYYNVVRDLADVGKWHGEALRIDVPKGTVSFDNRDAAAVLVQSATTGRILGAAWVATSSGS